MFGLFLSLGGVFLTNGYNIGVDTYRILTYVLGVINDCAYWIEHGTYQHDEIAARFHHRLVYIHPYPNGNGRHARLATDLLLRALDRPRFSWGSKYLTDAGEARTRYIEALRAADSQDYAPLLAFVRS